MSERQALKLGSSPASNFTDFALELEDFSKVTKASRKLPKPP